MHPSSNLRPPPRRTSSEGQGTGSGGSSSSSSSSSSSTTAGAGSSAHKPQVKMRVYEQGRTCYCFISPPPMCLDSPPFPPSLPPSLPLPSHMNPQTRRDHPPPAGGNGGNGGDGAVGGGGGIRRGSGGNGNNRRVSDDVEAPIPLPLGETEEFSYESMKDTGWTRPSSMR